MQSNFASLLEDTIHVQNPLQGKRNCMYKGRIMKPSLLAVFAHPDDEAFGTGGTLATYAAQGIQVTLVSATRGEAGEIADPTLAKLETLGKVREHELRCASQVLGIEEPIFLDYRDSGMAGTPENEHPQAFIQIPAEEVVGRLVGIIRRIQPQVVITFEPNGGYGHPDHIAIHRHTVEAFRAAADPTRFIEQGVPWQAHRLFYTAIPRSFFQEMRQRLEALGVDTSEFERFEQAGAGWPDEDVHVRLDVGAQIDVKWAAMQCHRTQFGPDSIFRRLPEDMGKQIMSCEHFALAWPEDVPEQGLADLFDGLTD
jgi:N-acetyl-1-D-myo-inositol-2-amino-2-deoxy-alpha-D-glucopyranoside deacetylase